MPFTGFYAGSSPHVKIVRNLLGAVRDLTLTEVKEATHYIAMASKTYRREQNSADDHLTPLLDADVKYRALVSESGLLDAAWYVMRYPEVGKSGLTPLDHFLIYGAKQGKSPGPDFDTEWYLRAYPDVGAESACTLYPAWTLRGTPSATTQRDIPESRRAEAAGRGVLGARR
jgi:hypothetical protein